MRSGLGRFHHIGGAFQPARREHGEPNKPIYQYSATLASARFGIPLAIYEDRTYRTIPIAHCSSFLHREAAMNEFKSGFFVGGESCNGRVLVVDDEPDIRKVVRMTLQKAGYEVLEAENGAKAIDMINTGENRLLLDVMVCDIRMPKVNGIEAITYFRQNYPRVPLIVLTGFPDTDMATSLLRQGVVDYLVKPVEGETLKASVARAMEQRELARL
jgi:two-component system chemotaxis response regulator CheY